jgi:hypothetical protein
LYEPYGSLDIHPKPFGAFHFIASVDECAAQFFLRFKPMLELPREQALDLTAWNFIGYSRHPMLTCALSSNHRGYLHHV